MLANLPDLKAHLRVSSAAADTALGAFLAAADAAVKTYLRWNPERAAATAYRDGSGTPELVFFHGRAVALSVTEVRLDAARGGYGQVPDSFGSDTVLTPGTDYLVDPAGILVRNSGAGSAGFAGWPGYSPGSGSVQWSGLGRRAAAAWPAYPKGCVKVTYTNGYAVAPGDLTAAVVQLAAWLSMAQETGGLIRGSSTFIDTGESLAPAAAEALGSVSLPAMGTVRQLLSGYREMVIPGGIR